jgi:acetoin utilization protein AcuC
VALGGGGYDISNVARAWTLAWAVMNGIELKEELPESYLKDAMRMGIEEKELRGRLKTSLHSQNKENRMEMERVVQTIKESVLPKIKG